MGNIQIKVDRRLTADINDGASNKYIREGRGEYRRGAGGKVAGEITDGRKRQKLRYRGRSSILRGASSGLICRKIKTKTAKRKSRGRAFSGTKYKKWGKLKRKGRFRGYSHRVLRGMGDQIERCTLYTANQGGEESSENRAYVIWKQGVCVGVGETGMLRERRPKDDRIEPRP